MNTEHRLRYLALMGPTAAGKTAAALALARSHALEIISVDSALVYRGMDIGTAKPTSAELALVPHHLINIRDPLQPYSAAEFATDARALIADITGRGKLPLLVGGTMLYFKALADGLDAMPKADAGVRAAIELEAQEKGWSAMHAMLALVDPVSAERLHPADSQRIARALEVFRLSGRPLSSFHSRPAAVHHADHEPVVIARSAATRQSIVACLQHGLPRYARNDDSTRHGACAPRDDAIGSRSVCGSGAELVARTDDQKSASESLLISLEPQSRAWLHQRIAERFDAMLKAGFIDEVKALRARGDLHADLPAMRCVGYRQAWQYLDALQAHEAERRWPLSELRDKGIAATRQLAKRQLTWLRAMPTRQVVVGDAPDAVAQVLKLARSFVQGEPIHSSLP